MTPRYSLVAFDFDGTLVDSEACIRLSLQRALDDCGLGSSTSVQKQWIGLPLQTIIRSIAGDIDDEAVASVVAAYRTHYAVLDPEVTQAFAGIVPLLGELAAAGVRLAVATNKHSTPARATLERLGVASLFTAIVGAESVDRPKPHPDILLRVLNLTGAASGLTLMVGDATVDLQMAAAAGVASCGVTWGNHSREELLAHGPTYVAESIAGLRQVIFG